MHQHMLLEQDYRQLNYQQLHPTDCECYLMNLLTKNIDQTIVLGNLIPCQVIDLGMMKLYSTMYSLRIKYHLLNHQYQIKHQKVLALD